MNRINFIYLLVSVLLVFTACSNEELLEKHPDGNYTSKLNITLSTASAITKAGDPVLFPATDQEKTIKSCVLAIFKKEGDTYNKKAIVEPTLEETETKGTYNIVSDVELLFSESYKIVIIANGDFNLYSECESYQDLKDIKEGSNSGYTFKSDELLKWGEKEVGADTDTELTVNTRLHIDLTQLAARIDLKINVNLKDEKELVDVSYEETDGSPLIGQTSLKGEIPVKGGLPDEYKTHKFLFYGRSVILEDASSASTKVGVMKSKTINRTRTYNSWILEPTSVIVKNVRNKVIAIFPEEDLQESLSDYDLSEGVNTQYVTFYTYQRSVEDPDDYLTNLRVEVQGRIYSAKVKEIMQVKGDFLAFNLKKEEIYNQIIEDTKNGKTSQITVSSTGEGQGWCILVEDATLRFEEIEGADVVVGEKSFVGEYKSGFDIKPEDGGPVAYGNYYKVTATIKSLKLPVSLKCIIVPMGSEEVTVPPFE